MTIGTPRSRRIGVVLLASSFLAGAAVGFGAERLFLRRSLTAVPVTENLSSVFDELSLTPAQRRQAQAIIEKKDPATEATIRQLSSRLRSISDSVDSELRAILTPEQQAKLSAMRRPLMVRRKL